MPTTTVALRLRIRRHCAARSESLKALFADQTTATPENELLRAIQRYLAESGAKRHFFSSDFCAWANVQDERPWSKDKFLTQAKLADVLAAYQIRPAQIIGQWTGNRKTDVATTRRLLLRYSLGIAGKVLRCYTRATARQ